MQAFFTLGVSAFLLCFLLTPVCRDIFVRANMVDQPDTLRKFHLRPVPRMGGIPIVLAYAGALGMVLVFNPGGGKLYIQHERLFIELLPAAALVFLTGLLDDIFELKPKQKLLGQLVAAVLAVSLGARLSSTHFPTWVAFILSVCWLIGCTNAVNLIDGMDGLATGVGLLATITTLLVALIGHNVGLALATVPLAGCLLAFLAFNFNPASVFLGDCGSLTIGFALGCFGLVWSQHTGTLLGVAAPLMALGLPLIDVALAIGRRYLRNRPIFSADRGHIHHMIQNFGFSTRSAAFILYGVCCLCASFALLENFSTKLLSWIILGVFLACVVAGINRLGYIEFIAAGRTLSAKFMRRAVMDEIYLEELSRALQKADTLDQWWEVVRRACSDLRFASAHLEVQGQTYFEQFVATPQRASCRIQVGFGDFGHLHLTRIPEQTPPRLMMAVLDMLQTSIEEREFIMADSEIATIASNAA
jgi:UDP-GlcNAc:undecaprenyl-phosphate GlcNAc-1-phosphate transferase